MFYTRFTEFQRFMQVDNWPLFHALFVSLVLVCRRLPSPLHCQQDNTLCYWLQTFTIHSYRLSSFPGCIGQQVFFIGCLLRLSTLHCSLCRVKNLTSLTGRRRFAFFFSCFRIEVGLHRKRGGCSPTLLGERNRRKSLVIGTSWFLNSHDHLVTILFTQTSVHSNCTIVITLRWTLPKGLPHWTIHGHDLSGLLVEVNS